MVYPAVGASLGSGTATIEVVLNNTPQGATANVSASGTATMNELGAPVSISNGDKLNFRTTSSSGTTGPCTAGLWLKYTE